ncbi:hypothetical protein OSTOST_20387, partial [Ostertagia ostertagi]
MQLDQSKWRFGDYLSVTFDAHGDGGNGSMTIRPLVVFDREAVNPGKILEIPLILTDRADKTNHASVHVIIGDEIVVVVRAVTSNAVIARPSVRGLRSVDDDDVSYVAGGIKCTGRHALAVHGDVRQQRARRPPSPA